MSLSASWSGTKRMETLPTATRGMTENRVGPKRYDASRACRARLFGLTLTFTKAELVRNGTAIAIGQVAIEV